MTNRYVERKIYELDWNDLSNFGPANVYNPCVYVMLNMTILEQSIKSMIHHRIGKATNIRQRLYVYQRTDPSLDSYRKFNEKIVAETTHVKVYTMPNMPHSTEEQRYRKNLAMEELEDAMILTLMPMYNTRQKEPWRIIKC